MAIPVEKISAAARRLNRRKFLQGVSAAAGAMALPCHIPASALGKGGTVAPSERIILGGIGLGGRGSGDLGSMLGEPDVQCVAVCDVRKGQREAIKNMVDGRYGTKDCATYRDIRQFLAERTDVDAVLIATGDRWHCAGLHHGHAGGKGRVLREAVVSYHGARPDGGRDGAKLRPRLSDRSPAAQRGKPRVRHRNGPHRPPGPDPYRLCRLSLARRDASRLAAGGTGAAQG